LTIAPDRRRHDSEVVPVVFRGVVVGVALTVTAVARRNQR
jgi:hypothetical protein